MAKHRPLFTPRGSVPPPRAAFILGLQRNEILASMRTAGYDLPPGPGSGLIAASLPKLSGWNMSLFPLDNLNPKTCYADWCALGYSHPFFPQDFVALHRREVLETAMTIAERMVVEEVTPSPIRHECTFKERDCRRPSKVIRTETPGNGQVVDPALGLRRFNHYVPVLIAESFGTKRP